MIDIREKLVELFAEAARICGKYEPRPTKGVRDDVENL